MDETLERGEEGGGGRVGEEGRGCGGCTQVQLLVIGIIKSRWKNSGTDTYSFRSVVTG